MRYYASEGDGTGGRLRAEPADFRVTEIERFGAEIRPVDADPGSYPHTVFRATLRGWDTNDFADALSTKLGISRERVSWAGTKDKRAVTTQLFSVRAVAPEELPEVRDAEIEPLGRAGRPVLFGDLAGNAFEIRVREPDHPEHAPAVASDLRAFAGHDRDDPDAPVGVPNFFGHQRFGSLRPITHRAGLEIVRGDWEAAVLSYVTTTSEAEPADTREAREWIAETRDWAGAVERLPGRLRYERAMCHALADADGDPGPEAFRGALETLPTNLQRLLVNAAQSYLFNEMLCRRIERGLPFHEAVEGDVVCFADRDAPEGLALPDTDRLQAASGDQPPLCPGAGVRHRAAGRDRHRVRRRRTRGGLPGGPRGVRRRPRGLRPAGGVPLHGDPPGGAPADRPRRRYRPADVLVLAAEGELRDGAPPGGHEGRPRGADLRGRRAHPATVGRGPRPLPRWSRARGRPGQTVSSSITIVRHGRVRRRTSGRRWRAAGRAPAPPPVRAPAGRAVPASTSTCPGGYSRRSGRPPTPPAPSGGCGGERTARSWRVGRGDRSYPRGGPSGPSVLCPVPVPGALFRRRRR